MKRIYEGILNNKFKVSILVVLILGIIVYSYKPVEFELKKEVVELEYGQKFDDYINYVKTKNIDENKLTYSCDTIDPNENFPTVGKHIVTYKYRGVTRELKISVEDTTLPKLTKLGDINIIENDKIEYKNYIQIDELSDYDIDIDDREVKYSLPGTYNAIIKVTDKYKNSSKISIPVTINKLELEISANSLNLETDQSNKLDIKTNSNAAVKFLSSDPSVVSIDGSGNIRALKAGNTTVSATINGKSVECNIIVKDKYVPKSSATINNSNDNVSYTVYITKTGDCYHQSNCRYLSKSKIPISKSLAQEQGYRACSRCN